MDLREIFQNNENVQEFNKSITIFAEETPGDLMYVVLDGEVEVWVGGKMIEIIQPGDIVGEMALIDSNKRSATAIAKSDCRLVPIDEKLFLFMVQQTPFFSLHVMRILVKRLRNMDSRVGA
jgi:CRP-like cAMP-binding protein